MRLSAMFKNVFITTALILSVTMTSCSSENSDSAISSPVELVATSVPRPVMPDVLCLSLQEAQDLIQDQGVFYSQSEDASGKGRKQLVDSNWIVVEQNLEPGTPFSEGDAVLGVIKDDEILADGRCQ